MRSRQVRATGWPPLHVLVASAALSLWGARLALMGVARFAGWRHVLRDLQRELDGGCAYLLRHLLTATGASALWLLCGALCLVAVIGLWRRRSWGRGLARALLLLAVAWHAIRTAESLDDVPAFLAGLLTLSFALALLVIVQDPSVDTWLASSRGDEPA